MFSLRPGVHASSAWAPPGHEHKAVVADTPPKPDPSEVSAWSPATARFVPGLLQCDRLAPVNAAHFRHRRG